MNQKIGLLLAATALLALTVRDAIAADSRLFMPIVGQNAPPQTLDYKEIGELAVWAMCAYPMTGINDVTAITLFGVWNKGDDTIKFTDNRTNYIYTADRGYWSQQEIDNFGLPFRITVTVVGGSSASLRVWCYIPNPGPTPIPQPDLTLQPGPTQPPLPATPTPWPTNAPVTPSTPAGPPTSAPLPPTEASAS